MTFIKTAYNKNSKTLLLGFVVLFFSFISFAQESSTYNITVTINNVKNTNGVVLLGLHNDTTFMKTKALKNAKSKIENNKISITFKDVKPGDYAIMAVHDENENNRMDFDSNGMPQESYGMSNNPMSYGPPQYGDAKFTVTDKDLKLNIRF
ncbi:DUF2141 domain-containing protein [Lacinutrix sp. MedPE-SW]|uniref:DUF2141 domain-containing protein n=1 Tax=Lacinutrix sp. MedPE-SW TaxID=1860087 RepID=UPI00090FF031|nr:DUF2141 domain-containing protein [Lacinutrix sp. MedPE-SW]OIQ22996.1 MAG: hypothetical protein BM549_05600 [Lacinutrix sp. MedPE-SW]